MKILLATDGSPYAQHAAAYVSDLCRRLKEESEVLVVYVKDLGGIFVAIPVEPGGEAFFDVEETRQAMEQRAAAALDAAQGALAGSNAQVTTYAPWGRPAEVICEMADAEAVDLIAVGSSGMGQITGLFLGSVSDRILHRAKRPVLVIRGAKEG